MNINSKVIVKNTTFLYIRMLLLMAITFYTLRIVLNALGTEDYGIYNIVGGIVVLLSFIQSAMTVAFQRFISFELGRGDANLVNRAFKGGMTITIIFTIVIFIILETIGLWIVNDVLKIPENNIFSANIVYQLSIITFIINFIRIPYQSLIISYENMSFFSIISVLEGILRLATAFIVEYIIFNRLIFYGILVMIVAIIITISYKEYCKKHFSSSKYNWYWETELCKKIISFSSYSMGISISNVVSQQGGNILLNYFYGLVANAALGIANQVGAAIMSFASSFQTAFNPQITKIYATKDFEKLFLFVIRASLYSYLLILILAAPAIIFMPWGLIIWLKDVPNFTVSFCIWIVIYQMIDALQAPLNTMLYATGNIRNYSLWLSILITLNLPISALSLYMGYSPVSVLIIRVVINFISAIIRTIYIKIKFNFPLFRYLKGIILRLIPTTTLVFIGSYFIKTFSIKDYEYIFVILSIFFSLLCTFFCGVHTKDRKKIYKFLKYKLF